MNPIGLVIDSGTNKHFSLYLEEIMLTEGYNSYDLLDVANTRLSFEIIKNYSLIIIGYSAAENIEWDLLERYVYVGGTLVAIKPPRELDYLFGLEKVSGISTSCYIKTNDGYLVMNKGHFLAPVFETNLIQFIGEADLYQIKSAECLTFISAAPDPNNASIYPGIALNTYGSGKAAIFTYDLSECIVRLHQGNPMWSSTGIYGDPYKDNKYTASDLFKDQICYDLRLIPQADVHQDLLVMVLRLLSKDSFPLPRIWYFPSGAPAVAFINGDSDGMTTDEYELVLNTTEEFKGKYTCYIMDKDQEAISPHRVTELRDRGHDFGPHLFCGTMPSLQEMGKEIKRAVESFKNKYGFQPLTHRGHSTIWVGWSEMAQALFESGIRLDTNFTCSIGLERGFINGSGLPVKFINENGKIIDLYEQSTQLTDDGPFSHKIILKIQSYEEVISNTLDMLKTCIKYHGVFHPYYHPTATSNRKTLPIIRQTLKSCLELCIPFVNGSGWVSFNDARREIKYEKCNWNSTKGCLSMELISPMEIKNLTLLLPHKCKEYYLDNVTINRKRVCSTITTKLEKTPWSKVIFDLKQGDKIDIEAYYSCMINS